MKLLKKLSGYVLCGVMITTLSGSAIAGAEDKKLSLTNTAEIVTMSSRSGNSSNVTGKVENINILGVASITRHAAVAQTTQTGTTGEVTAGCTATYRDVSTGKTKTLYGGNKTSTMSVSKKVTVSEEDYMKSMTGTHKYSNGKYSWSDSTSDTYYN